LRSGCGSRRRLRQSERGGHRPPPPAPDCKVRDSYGQSAPGSTRAPHPRRRRPPLPCPSATASARPLRGPLRSPPGLALRSLVAQDILARARARAACRRQDLVCARFFVVRAHGRCGRRGGCGPQAGSPKHKHTKKKFEATHITRCSKPPTYPSSGQRESRWARRRRVGGERRAPAHHKGAPSGGGRGARLRFCAPYWNPTRPPSGASLNRRPIRRARSAIAADTSRSTTSCFVPFVERRSCEECWSCRRGGGEQRGTNSGSSTCPWRPGRTDTQQGGPQTGRGSNVQQSA
jgi:hypothetical protein